MSARYRSATTHELRVGDVVNNYGMRLLVDQPPVQSRSHPVTEWGGACLWTKALVLNPAEVEAAGVVPASWIWLDRDGQRMAEPRWTIQGNRLATWAVELEGGAA